MRQNPNYTLTHLAGEPYLLPYGQLIVEYRRGMKLNETGELIWRRLAMRQSRERLLADLRREFEVSSSEEAQFSQDINEFLDRLVRDGVILEDPAPDPIPCAALSIAGNTILLCGPREAFSEEFGLFYLPPEEGKACDLTVTVSQKPAPPAEGICLLDDPNLTVYEQADRYLLAFRASRQLSLCELYKNGRNADFYVIPPYNDELRYDLFHAIRTVFLYHVAPKGMCAIHSASILYRDRAWLFSGPSGTGKSTHTGLWQQYVGTPCINGDLNLLAFDEGGRPVIRGIPWCGTSGICDDRTYPLGGIILLKQDNRNMIYPLSESDQQLALLQRLISPRWDAAMLLGLSDFIGRLVPRIQVHRLGCTISEEAVRVIREEIDRGIS